MDYIKGNMKKKPFLILYSFRRCPYAMRARLALAYNNIEFEQREINLKKKPVEFIKLSPKGTVPVLENEDGTLLEESIEIISFAFTHNEFYFKNEHLETLIIENDNEFKDDLDRYKYADRFPEHPQIYYRQNAEHFLEEIELILSSGGPYLEGSRMGYYDMAIFPFIRQFSNVDKGWFFSSQYKYVIKWQQNILNSDLFKQNMRKFPFWEGKK